MKKDGLATSSIIFLISELGILVWQDFPSIMNNKIQTDTSAKVKILYLPQNSTSRPKTVVTGYAILEEMIGCI